MMSNRACDLNRMQSDFAPFIAGSSLEWPTTHMPQRFAKQIVVAALAYVAIGGGVAWADRHQQRTDPRDGDLPASVRRVQRETGGQVLKAQPILRDGREVYRVKVLTPQGRIRVVEEIPPPLRERPLRNEPQPPHPPHNHRPE